ncbi:winged helix-turn-helix domain-containing protein [Enterococcus sp. 669A]|uniref:Winged helix-turn-helix domain-containing protein n=1 Tax=Candidatus Enterococcus moelleringii TaxID=2815325 RepID=A0ABS3LIJ6_9ENTE|nr:helix-turn-helix domain-containing protein [Enterococcus sp. 669A]MBO1308536.1 winged helix-turn-helix domain-containing protein [Enterococcus sp. 669A]
MNVLILTNCLLAEMEFTKKLNMLGYEVFCSHDLLNKFKEKNLHDNVTKFFQNIIISETVSDGEMEDLLKNKFFYSDVLYRKTSSSLDVLENKDSRIQDLILPDEPLESLREKLSKTNRNKVNLLNKQFIDPSTISSNNLNGFLPFSKQEKIVFEILREANGNIVSREKICETIWSEVTQSNLARTSSILKNIKIKLEEVGIDNSNIQTLWGKGYRLV